MREAVGLKALRSHLSSSASLVARATLVTIPSRRRTFRRIKALVVVDLVGVVVVPKV